MKNMFKGDNQDKHSGISIVDLSMYLLASDWFIGKMIKRFSSSTNNSEMTKNLIFMTDMKNICKHSNLRQPITQTTFLSLL